MWSVIVINKSTEIIIDLLVGSVVVSQCSTFGTV